MAYHVGKGGAGGSGGNGFRQPQSFGIQLPDVQSKGQECEAEDRCPINLVESLRLRVRGRDIGSAIGVTLHQLMQHKEREGEAEEKLADLLLEARGHVEHQEGGGEEADTQIEGRHDQPHPFQQR